MTPALARVMAVGGVLALHVCPAKAEDASFSPFGVPFGWLLLPAIFLLVGGWRMLARLFAAQVLFLVVVVGGAVAAAFVARHMLGAGEFLTVVAGVGGAVLGFRFLIRVVDERSPDPAERANISEIGTREAGRGAALSLAASPDAADPDLIRLVKAGSVARVRDLLEAGRSLEGVDERGRTLIQIAQGQRDVAMAELLQFHLSARDKTQHPLGRCPNCDYMALLSCVHCPKCAPRLGATWACLLQRLD